MSWNNRSIVLILPFLLLGCVDRGSRLYTDAITDQSGNAVKTNIASQASDTLPPRSGDKRIVTDVNKRLPPRAEKVTDTFGSQSTGAQ